MFSIYKDNKIFFNIKLPGISRVFFIKTNKIEETKENKVLEPLVPSEQIK